MAFAWFPESKTCSFFFVGKLEMNIIILINKIDVPLKNITK